MDLFIPALIGAAIGHIIRRLTPYYIGWKDKSLPFSFPWPELALGLAFLFIAREYGVALPQWKWYLFAVLLLSVTTTDQLCKYIRIDICLGGAAIGLILHIIWPTDIIGLLAHENLIRVLGFQTGNHLMNGAFLSLAGAGMGYLQMEFIRKVFGALAQTEVMGGGDTLLMVLVGAFLGPQVVLFSLLPACLIGILMGGIRKIMTGEPHFPFGPALAMGGLVMLLMGKRMLDLVGQFHHALQTMPAPVLLGFSIFLVVVLVFLVLRLQRKAAEYERQIEEDYEEIDKKMQS